MNSRAEDRSQEFGQVFVFSGPSGVGKGSIIKGVLEHLDGLELSVSVTTRPMRSGEVHGREYYFVDKDEFLAMIERGDLLEWAKVYDYMYGTPLPPIKEKLESGQDVILEIDVQGARLVREKLPDAVTVFVEPPSLEDLEVRLRARGTDSEEAICTRLDVATGELKESSHFDYRIVNDDLETAIEAAVDIIIDSRKERGK